MKTLRKRPTYDEMYNVKQPEFKLPDRKGIRAINHPVISNLLYDDDFKFSPQEEQEEYLMISDKATQTPHEKGTQTHSLEKGTQIRSKPEHYDLYPHLYYKIDAMSKMMTHSKPKEKNDATSETIALSDMENDNKSQTSKYIPGGLKKKSDNINQTIRYVLKSFESPMPTPQPTPIPSPTPSQEDLPEYVPKNSWWKWFMPEYDLEQGDGSDPPLDPPSPPSKPSDPSEPSVGIRSPSESPPSSEGGYPSFFPPFSPSPVAYPASEDEAEGENKSQSRSYSSKSNSSKSNGSKRKK